MADFINDLAVRIETSDIFRAGTDNDVYFDIGPLGWLLDLFGHNNFERGASDIYPLDLHGLALSTDEIVWLHLQKKGVGGVTGTSDLPDGGWHPQRIILMVNNAEFARVEIDRWIDEDNSSWMHVLRSGESPSELFARTLRMLPNNQLSQGDENVAFLSTPFKIMGISGWLGTGLPTMCATGTVVRTPAESTDGLATIDLALKTVQVGDQVFILDGKSGIGLDRFLRIEFKFRAPFPIASGQQFLPSNGDAVRICGDVQVDSDQEGWYEIHPRGHDDVRIGPPPTSLREFLGLCQFDPSQGLRCHVPLATTISLRALMGL